MGRTEENCFRINAYTREKSGSINDVAYEWFWSDCEAGFLARFCVLGEASRADSGGKSSYLEKNWCTAHHATCSQFTVNAKISKVPEFSSISGLNSAIHMNPSVRG